MKKTSMNRSENKFLKYGLIGISIFFLILMLIIPLISIISEALAKGFGAYIKAISDGYTLKAMNLTLIATLIATIMNTIFGICVAWTITKFKFRGKNLLGTLIDLPFAISPVIAGLIFVLTFGKGSFLENILVQNNIKIVFAVPGIILATIFVTFPFVAREIIPLMNAQGTDEEEAAAMMALMDLIYLEK